MGLTSGSTGRGAVDRGLGEHVREDADYTVAIAGNPNVGKSTLFNNLTGMHQHTGNWPGKTVSCASGLCKSGGIAYAMIDLPGTYSLMAHSAEEEVARDFLVSGGADAVVVVCDAVTLERNLNLVLQTMAITGRVVVCVNMLGEAEKKGIFVDLDRLSAELGVPVLGVDARKKRSFGVLFAALSRICRGEEQAQVRALSGGTEEEQTYAIVAEAERIAAASVRSEKIGGYSRRDRALDRVLTSRRFGYPLMVLLLLFVFWLTIAGANVPSALLSDLFALGKGWLVTGLSALGAPMWLRSLLADGIYGVTASVISVMLPPMAIFFPLFTLLEDSGYLPRIAYNLDRPFQKCRACGKQSLTMCMGFGCNAAGVVGCRIMDSERERLIAILTNSFVPCNGRFPMIIAMITMFFVGTGGGLLRSVGSAVLLAAVILFGIGMTFLASRILSATVLRGAPSSFTLELPPYRRPQIGKVLVRSIFDRTLFVLGRAAAVAVPAGAVIWVCANVHVGGASLLAHATSFLDPAGRLLGMDGVILTAFILGFPANEMVLPIALMAYMAEGIPADIADLSSMHAVLVSNGWTWITAVSTILFSLMHWPCSTTMLTVKKETGSLRWTAASFFLPTAFGGLVCFLFSNIARLFV